MSIRTAKIIYGVTEYPMMKLPKMLPSRKITMPMTGPEQLMMRGLRKCFLSFLKFENVLMSFIDLLSFQFITIPYASVISVKLTHTWYDIY